MVDTKQIREHLEVIGSDGQHVGTVDHLDGNSIKLTKSDRGAGGQHHWISTDYVESVEGDKVRLSLSASDAQQNFSTAAP